jgi:hypothetical protein
MPVPSRRLKDLIEGTVDHHASQRWPALEEVTIRWRGSYGYLTGYLSEDDDDTITLCRIQYLGDPDEWAFAIWQASTDSYAESVLLDGRPAGHPNLALDTACTLYLAGTSDHPVHPDKPLKDLRGAALVRGNARISGVTEGMPVHRCLGRASGLWRGGPGCEQVPLAERAAAGLGVGTAGLGVGTAAVGRGAVGRGAVTQRAGGVSAGGLALLEQIVAVLADGGGLAARLAESAAGLAAATRGAARAGQQQAQPEQGQSSDHDAVEEQRSGRAGHVIAEHREMMGEPMPIAAIGQDAGYSGDDRRDQDDEPDNYDHDVLR